MRDPHAVLLAIESSCDETGVALFRGSRLLSNLVATQDVHAEYGGVVPELASRAHLQHMVPTLKAALEAAEVTLSEIKAVACTQAPGLIGSLMVGMGFAKSLSYALQVPLIGVHHMQAHVLAHFIREPRPTFPFLCLTVSGGHTQIVLVKDYLNMTVLGSTLDDAAGEAFDKIAKMLRLPYPGGPLIDKFAQQGDPHRFTFPVPGVKGLDFSFSGIKTSVLYFLQKMLKMQPDFIKSNLPDLCASVQHTLISALMSKLELAADRLGVRQIGIAGGVSANRGLRQALEKTGAARQWQVFIPDFEFCTDNAAMIGITAYYKWLAGETTPLDALPSARSAW